MRPGEASWLYGLWCLLAIFLPAWLLIGGALPFWHQLRARRWAQAALAGANAAVVGVLLAALYSPIITEGVRGPRDVDVSLARNHGKLLVHLVNTSGPHATDPFVDALTPVGPLHVTLRIGSRPKRLTLEPGGRSLEFNHAGGETRFTVAEVPIHSVAVVE